MQTKSLLFLSTWLLSTGSLVAQIFPVNGRVSNIKAEPLPGVTVQIKNKTIGTSTDFNGSFSLQVSEKDTLLFSFLGMKTMLVPITASRKEYNVTLEDDVKTLNEVVVGFKRVNVFSRRREEDLQKVPESVTAFTAKDIEQAGLSNVADFVALTPNVTLISAQNIGNIAITTRGISQVRNGDAPVAYVVDGVIMPSPNSINQELFDIELIEVMKGPQGALYGRNALGGAVNVITKKPTNKFENSAKVEYGNGKNAVQATSSGRIIPNRLLYRIGAFSTDRKGLIKNATTQRNVDYIGQSGVRGQLLGTPSNRFNFDLGFSYSKAKAGAIYYAPLADDKANDFSQKPVSDSMGVSNRELTDGHVKLSYDFSDFADLEYIGAVSHVYEKFSGDLDFTASSFLAQSQALKNTGITNELRLTSKTGKPLRWIVGAYMMNNKRNLTTVGSADLANPLSQLVFGLPTGTGFAPFLQRDEENHNSTVAGFLQANYDIAANLEVSAAARYDLDKREQTNLRDNTTRKKNFDAFQPKVTLSYKNSEHVMTYLGYSQGFRSGGFNAPGVAMFPSMFDKETTANAEIGIKTNWFDNRLVFNASAFYINFQNQQVFIVDLATVSQGIINIKRTVSQGFEMELKAMPFKNVELMSGFGLTDAKIKKLDSNTEWEGNHSPLTAASTFNVVAQYTLPLTKGLSLVPRADFERKGTMYWHVDNKDKQNPVPLFNARLSVVGERFTWTGFVNNIFDKRYNNEFFAKEFSGGGSDIRWQAQPLTWGTSLKVNF